MEPMWAPIPEESPEKVQRRQVRKAANFCGGVVVAMYGMQFLVSVILQCFVAGGAIHPDQPDYGLGVLGKELLDMLTYLLVLAVPALLVAAVTRTRVSPFPTRRVGLPLLLCLVLGGMAMAIMANVATAYVLAWLEEWGIMTESYPSTVDPTPMGLVLGLISTAVLPALVEEMIFRGYLLGTLRPLGNGIAVVTSAFLFGLFHGNVQQFVFAFILGLVLAFLTVQTKSIWPAVVLHFSNNAMAVFLDYASQFTSEADAGATNIITFGLICVAGVVAFGALLITDRGSTATTAALRPVYNRVGAVSPAKRVGYLFTAPLFLLALAVMLVDIIGTVTLA